MQPAVAFGLDVIEALMLQVNNLLPRNKLNINLFLSMYMFVFSMHVKLLASACQLCS